MVALVMRTDKDSENYSEEETEARREAALKMMLASPRKPHGPIEAVKATPTKG